MALTQKFFPLFQISWVSYVRFSHLFFCYVGTHVFYKGSAKYLFIGNCFKKNYWIYFSNFFFYLKVQSFRLIMENNFFQMAASAGHAVANTIDPIFKHIIDCVQLYFTNGFTNIVLSRVNCLWLVDVTLIFDGLLQIMVQRCQIAAPRWSNEINSVADNAIFKNRAQNIVCSFGCVARSTVLLKPNVANILLFNFCEQKFFQHGSFISSLLHWV